MKQRYLFPHCSADFRLPALVLALLLMILCTGTICAEDAPVFLSGEWGYTENETGITLIGYIGNETDLKIPNSLDGRPVTQLGTGLFSNDWKLERVSIPDSVTVIGNNAFSGCHALREVRLSSSLKTISSGLFRDCLSLEQFELPLAIKSIGTFAFSGCVSLRQVMLNNITSIGESAFENCTNLTSVIYTQSLTSVGPFAFRNTPWLDTQTDEFVYIGKKILLKWNGSGKEVEVPYNTVMISGAFAGNAELEKVSLPDTVRNIGGAAFKDCINLESINFPQYLTTIGANAFEGCRSLKEAALPKSLTSLGSSAFRGCKKLEQVVIPKKVKTISSFILADCPALKDVVILGKEVTKFDNRAFQGSGNVRIQLACETEAEVLALENEIPYSCLIRIVSDFVYQQAENGIRILKYTGDQPVVEIPAEIDGLPVTQIGSGAFQNNGCVRTIILPPSIETIGDWAFMYMDSLDKVILPENANHLIGRGY